MERASGNGWPTYETHQHVMCFQCESIPTSNDTVTDTMPECSDAETLGLDIGRYYQVCPICDMKTFYNLARPKLRVVT